MACIASVQKHIFLVVHVDVVQKAWAASISGESEIQSTSYSCDSHCEQGLPPLSPLVSPLPPLSRSIRLYHSLCIIHLPSIGLLVFAQYSSNLRNRINICLIFSRSYSLFVRSCSHTQRANIDIDAYMHANEINLIGDLKPSAFFCPEPCHVDCVPLFCAQSVPILWPVVGHECNCIILVDLFATVHNRNNPILTTSHVRCSRTAQYFIRMRYLQFVLFTGWVGRNRRECCSESYLAQIYNGADKKCVSMEKCDQRRWMPGICCRGEHTEIHRITLWNLCNFFPYNNNSKENSHFLSIALRDSFSPSAHRLSTWHRTDR